MRRLLLAVLVVLGLAFVLSPLPAHAQDDIFNSICQNTPEADVCKEKNDPATLNDNTVFGANGILTRAAQIITVVVGVAAVIMITVGGIKYTLSAGDSSKANSAKDTIIYSLVGIVVALAAQAIIVFVLRRI